MNDSLAACQKQYIIMSAVLPSLVESPELRIFLGGNDVWLPARGTMCQSPCVQNKWFVITSAGLQWAETVTSAVLCLHFVYLSRLPQFHFQFIFGKLHRKLCWFTRSAYSLEVMNYVCVYLLGKVDSWEFVRHFCTLTQNYSQRLWARTPSTNIHPTNGSTHTLQSRGYFDQRQGRYISVMTH